MIGISPNSHKRQVTVTGNQDQDRELKTDEKNQARGVGVRTERPVDQ